MPAQQDIQQCIQTCEQTAGQLRSMAKAETNPQMKTMLDEGAHHLDLCVVECKYSVQELQTAMQPA